MNTNFSFSDVEIVYSNLSLLIDEGADIIEVSLLDRENVCSEAKLHLQG